MNKWQKIYCDTYYNGKKPRTKIGKQEFELLGQTLNEVTVEFSNGKSETFKVTEFENDMPNGLISVCTLASNLSYWLFRGFKVTTS